MANQTLVIGGPLDGVRIATGDNPPQKFTYASQANSEAAHMTHYQLVVTEINGQMQYRYRVDSVESENLNNLDPATRKAFKQMRESS